ncbi:hypothetical protein [Sphingobacterium spiritivorum]|uniref:hypothetical protein n=1 Tax=Sphingobacterium spiritivorum TaxID=258 RepID=UPI003DA60562
MKITTSSEVVRAILQAIETNIVSQGVAMQCKITHEFKGDTAWIKFKPKKKIKPEDWFWFGFFVREYKD